MRTLLVVMALLVSGLTGCGKAPEPTPAPKPQAAVPAPAPATAPAAAPAAKPAPSTMQTVVDGFTGRAVIQQGKAAGEKAKAIRDKEQADLNEVMQ
jgi:hypothetical protein